MTVDWSDMARHGAARCSGTLLSSGRAAALRIGLLAQPRAAGAELAAGSQYLAGQSSAREIAVIFLAKTDVDVVSESNLTPFINCCVSVCFEKGISFR